MGDGMSVATITASRIYKGQLENKTGEEQQLFFETFPFVGLSKVPCDWYKYSSCNHKLYS